MALIENWSDHIKTVIREEIKTNRRTGDDVKSSRVEPPEFVKTISDCCVAEGQPAHFVYTLKPNSSVTNVQWFRNNELVRPEKNSLEVISDGDQAGCLIISSAANSNSGTYKVLASNEKGSTQCRATLLVSSDNQLMAVDKTSQTLVDKEMQTEEKDVELSTNKRKLSSHSDDDETSRKLLKDNETEGFNKRVIALETK